jgi:hypothetical protein
MESSSRGNESGIFSFITYLAVKHLYEAVAWGFMKSNPIWCSGRWPPSVTLRNLFTKTRR